MPVRRSRRTPFSDNALTILDHLCFQNACVEDLSYGLALTAPYAESMTYEQLLETLKSLRQQNCVAANDENAPVYRVTESGAAVWQSERTPEWNRFIISHNTADKQNRLERWCLQASNREVILDLLEVYQRLGLIEKKPQALKLCAVELLSLTYWKQTSGYQCTFNSRSLQHGCGYKEIEALRSWWSAPSDFLTKKSRPHPHG